MKNNPVIPKLREVLWASREVGKEELYSLVLDDALKALLEGREVDFAYEVGRIWLWRALKTLGVRREGREGFRSPALAELLISKLGG